VIVVDVMVVFDHHRCPMLRITPRHDCCKNILTSKSGVAVS
jgi:hypothetical protein